MRLAQRHDNRSVVGGFLQGAWAAINLTSFEPFGQGWAKKEMVDANATIVIEGLSEVIPESELPCGVGVQRAECVCVA